MDKLLGYSILFSFGVGFFVLQAALLGWVRALECYGVVAVFAVVAAYLSARKGIDEGA